LTLTLSEVYEQNRVTLILANLVEIAQLCDVEDEAYEVLRLRRPSAFIQGGSISILNPTTNELEVRFNGLRPP